jgi:hypothetical protein
VYFIIPCHVKLNLVKREMEGIRLYDLILPKKFHSTICQGSICYCDLYVYDFTPRPPNDFDNLSCNIRRT